jgi:hypothetical protein
MKTANQLLVKLNKLKAGGASHRDLIETAKNAPHHGYDISDDETMMVIHYPCTKVIIAPYNQIYLVDTTH